MNNTYNQKTNTNTTSTVIGSCVFASQGQTTQYFYGSNTTTFIKNKDIASITITLLKILDNSKPSTTNAFPNIIFIFDIEGVEAYRVKDVTESRLLK